MVLLLALVVILSGEPALCLQEEGAFTLDGDIRQFAVTTDTVYIATEETLYQLSHSLTLVQSLSLRGILKEGKSVEDAQFHRVSETTERNATFNVHREDPGGTINHCRNHAVLSGYNLSDVTRVRLQRDTACAAQESPVWNNTGVNLTFHIPSTDYKGVVSVCVVLPDGSCHGNYGISYQSSPTCIRTEPNSAWFSGKRTITLIGSHREFVEGVIHSHNPQDVTLPRSSKSGNLTFETNAAKSTQQSLFSSVSLKVANETLVCSTSFKYHPDPEFITFKSLTTMGYVLIIVEKKKDELEVTTAELSVWGVHGGKQHPCVMTGKETSNKMEFFHCHIKNIPDATFQELMIHYGDRTVRLGPPSLLHQVLLILRVLLIPCVFIGEYPGLIQ
ncbi:uncharacterized protein LOC114862669 [Betta splendens]|uniref:Uncharacterized protein LOC114862669 n=1 Tax=Betta splendens TaxID=158456 RepID=A0A8M1HIK6_BETSP|nr:uncharacterized protein LOC114862669 [Betta splendens]